MNVLRTLRLAASDPRWRIREAVAMALQWFGEVDMGALSYWEPVSWKLTIHPGTHDAEELVSFYAPYSGPTWLFDDDNTLERVARDQLVPLAALRATTNLNKRQ